MEKIKNFVYDKSDLLVAIIIVGLAALVIWFGITNIMKPVTEDPAVASGKPGTEQSTDAAISEGAVNTPAAATTPAAVPEQAPQAQPEQKPIKITISSGDTSDQIGEKLLAAGAITDKKAFAAKLEELGLATKLQEGTFKIPVGTTMEDICKIVTKTN